MYFCHCPDLKQRLLTGRFLKGTLLTGNFGRHAASYQSLSWGEIVEGEGGAEYHGHPGPRTRVVMAVQPSKGGRRADPEVTQGSSASEMCFQGRERLDLDFFLSH